MLDPIMETIMIAIDHLFPPDDVQKRCMRGMHINTVDANDSTVERKGAFGGNA